MLCNPLSFYPDKIDPLLFFQDVNLEKIEIMDTYDDFIKKGKYTKADEFINSQSGICGYFADFFNAIENRIYNLQEYLLTIEPKQPFIYSDEEPNIKEDGTHDLLSDHTFKQLSKYTHKELSGLVDRKAINNETIWI